MKKINLFFAVLFFAALIISCSKNEIVEESALTYRSSNLFTSLGITEEDVQVNDGILKFKDKNTLDRVYKALDSLRDDSIIISQCLNTLGLSWDDKDSINSPWDPVLLVFSSSFAGFMSIGAIEETRERQYLLNGGNPSEFQRIFLKNKVWQFLMNDKYEIQVGDIIFKFISKDNFFIIVNNDLASLNKLRALDNLQDFEIDKNTFYINYDIKEDRALFYRLTKFNDNGFFDRYFDPLDECKVEIVVVPLGDDNYRLYAISFFSGSLKYHWKIYNSNGLKVVDKTTSSPATVVKLSSNNVSFYNIYLEAYNHDKSCIAEDDYRLEIDNCSCDFDFNVYNSTIRWEGAAAFDVFDIRLSGIEDYSCDYDLRINWGDGDVITYHHITKYQSFSHEYIINPNNPGNPQNGTTERTIVVRLINHPDCSKSHEKKVLVGCGNKVDDIYGKIIYQSSPKRKLVYELEMDYAWALQNLTYFNVKATNKKRKLWIWWTTKAKRIEAHILKSVITYDCTAYSDIGTPTEYVTNKSKLGVTEAQFSTNDVTVKHGYVSVDFYVTDDDGDIHGPYNLTW